MAFQAIVETFKKNQMKLKNVYKDGWVDGGIWTEFAQRYNAYLLVAEHRFYGQSWPASSRFF
jgi:hypothetical protein